MPKISYNKDEIIKHEIINRELKKDEKEKGRLALGVGFFKDFDNHVEVIEIIRRKKNERF